MSAYLEITDIVNKHLRYIPVPAYVFCQLSYSHFAVKVLCICANRWLQFLTFLFGRGLSLSFGSQLRLLLSQRYIAHGPSKQT